MEGPQTYPARWTEGKYYHSIGTSDFQSFAYQRHSDSDRVRGEYKWGRKAGKNIVSSFQFRHLSWIESIRSSHKEEMLDCASNGCSNEGIEGCHLDYDNENYIWDENNNEYESDETNIFVIVPICRECHDPSKSSDEALSINLNSDTPCIIDTRSEDDVESSPGWWCHYCDNEWLEPPEDEDEGAYCFRCDKHSGGTNIIF